MILALNIVADFCDNKSPRREASRAFLFRIKSARSTISLVSSTLINMLKDFKQFLLRGNAVDLAIGVVVGAAFGTVVSAIVSDILTPLIAAIARVPDFSGLVFTVNGSKFLYGHFLNTFISFILVSTAVFFFVVKPMNVLIARSKLGEPADPTTKKCSECMSEIPFEAKRCKYCGQVVG